MMRYHLHSYARFSLPLLIVGLTINTISCGVAFNGLKAHGATGRSHAAVGSWHEHDHSNFGCKHGVHPHHPNHPPTKKASYIVFLKDPPVVDYTGDNFLPATKPLPGHKIDITLPQVQTYTTHLHSRRLSVVRDAGLHDRDTLIHSYEMGFNGFAARLTKDQAAYLQQHDAVLSVEEDKLLKVKTIRTPNLLGLDKPKVGLWDQLGGVLKSGEDMVVGILDFGILPEHVSFSERSDDGVQGYKPIPGWKYNCTFGGGMGNKCTQKVIACKSYRKGWLAEFAGPSTPFTDDTCRDTEIARHGSHVASTAAGNHRTFTQLYGSTSVAFGRMSGMAPRARLAIYRVCWGREDFDDEGCSTSDIVAALEAAISDGVDVINLSLGGSAPEPLISDNPLARATFLAAAKGIFVAAAAGNDGPSLSTVINVQPWVTTVGNSDVDRLLQGVLRLGDGQQYVGRVWWKRTAEVPIILASSALNTSFKPPPQFGFTALQAATVCFNGSLDATKVKGKIVVCENAGEYELKPRYPAYVYMGEVVKNASGAGFVLVNREATDMDSITGYYRLPYIQLPSRWLGPLKAYASKPDAVARITPVRVVSGSGRQAPTVFITSSKGPLPDFHVLKPDVIAPGTDILAASSPPSGANPRLSSSRHTTAFLTGTSMATPHVTGLGVLLKQLHPTWSPMAIRSALVTTGNITDNKGGVIEGDVYSIGGGVISPVRAADPGLVYDSGSQDWDRYLCAQDFKPVLHSCSNVCKGKGGCGHPANLNQPSIAINRLFGELTITRTVTNVAQNTSTYTSSVQGLKGIKVTVSPSTITIKTGAKKTFRITFDPADAVTKDFITGSLTWTDGTHTVRSPMVVDTIKTITPLRVTFANVTTKPPSYVISSTSKQLNIFNYKVVPAVVQQRKVRMTNTPSQWGVINIPENTALVRIQFSSPNNVAAPLFRAFLQQNDGTATWLNGSPDGFNHPTEDYLVNAVAQKLTIFTQTASKKARFANQPVMVELKYWIIPADFATKPPQMTAEVAGTKNVGGGRYNVTVGLTFNGLKKGTEYTSLVLSGAPGASANNAVSLDNTVVAFTA